jgi:peroxiredoxin
MQTQPLLNIGDRFPPAQTVCCDGQEVVVDQWPRLILFYRGHWCGHCRRQLGELARYASSFQSAGAGVTAISTDSSELCHAMAQDLRGAIEIRRDPDARLARALGLADRDDAVPYVISRPAAFVVDADGIVRYCYVSRSPEDRPMPDLLLLAFESLGRWAN